MAETFLYSTNYAPPAPVANIIVRRRGEIALTAMLDTGADGTIIPIDLLQQIGAEYLETRRMRSITGQSQTVNMYAVEIQIGPHRIPGVAAAAISANNETIIGRDVLNQLIINLDGIAGQTEIS